MKKTIYMFILVFALIGPAFGEPSSNSGPDDKSLYRLVDFGPAATAQLQQLGFALAGSQIKAPDFAIKDMKGNLRSLSSFRGKLVVLNFWGVWCYYCRLEMPSMQRFYQRFKDKGLEIVAVDVNDQERTVRDFIAKNNLTFPVLLDTELKAVKQYGPSGFPTTFLIDKDGNVKAKLVGARTWDETDMINVFEKLLASP